MSDDKPVISDEAVEAAAKALYEMENQFLGSWDHVPGGMAAGALARATAVLEAAAPHMLDRERTAELIAEYGNELVGSSGGPEHLEYTYSDAILGVAE